MASSNCNVTFARFLEGKTAVVTGCSRGIGRAIAVGLGAVGAHVIGTATRSGNLDETARDILSVGGSFEAREVDFADRQQTLAFAGSLIEGGPCPDVLVNNAGIIRRQPAEEHSDAKWDEVMAVNLDAPFLLTREVGKQMVQRGRGSIVFVASLLTFQGGILVPGYAASKGAIGQLTKAFANEWAGRGVSVNAIAPGYIRTDNTTALQEDPVREAGILARIPAGRWGEPDDIAGMVTFLCSPSAQYIHGIVVPVDGGWMGR